MYYENSTIGLVLEPFHETLNQPAVTVHFANMKFVNSCYSTSKVIYGQTPVSAALSCEETLEPVSSQGDHITKNVAIKSHTNV